MDSASPMKPPSVYGASRQLQQAEVVYKEKSQVFQIGPRRQQSKQVHFGVCSLTK